jgi:NADP-dependent 3-hydroxy acid dehydrogenase YdfG
MSASADSQDSDIPRIAVVTGASAGIGRTIAVALGALGWKVAIGARRMDKLREVSGQIEKAGGEPYAYELDVTKVGSIDAFFDSVESEFGAPDVVVNNAGLSVPGLLHELDPSDVEREVATNLLGPMLVARRAIPAMRKGKRGDLVFITSLNAVLPRAMQVPYTATKTGLEAAVRTLQMELEGTGVRATIIRPGPTVSEFALSWTPEQVQSAMDTWSNWGSLRHAEFLPTERIAEAVVQVVTAPRGTHWDLIQINPEAPLQQDD